MIVLLLENRMSSLSDLSKCSTNVHHFSEALATDTSSGRIYKKKTYIKDSFTTLKNEFITFFKAKAIHTHRILGKSEGKGQIYTRYRLGTGNALVSKNSLN